MPKTNEERLQEIAGGMQELNDRLVYVGGAMAGLYATDPVAVEPRTTLDVDCVVNSNNYAEHIAFEELLRTKNFHNDRTPDAPLCRWVFNGEQVDVMSMDENSFSFGNRWYRPGFSKREPFTLSSGMVIYRLSVTYYIATKIEALLSRGGEDWRGSIDFEDIIYVLNYCPEFVEEFEKEDTTVQKFVADQFARMLKRPNISEEIECSIALEEIERSDLILETMRTVAAFKPNMLRIQFVSDLHLEFPQNRSFMEKHPLEVKGNILLVAGDTAYLDLPDSKQDSYSQYSFWDWASEHYEQVIVCFGNHDFYGHYDLATMPDAYRKTIRSNVHAYYNSVVHIGNADIIVSTLWAHIEPYNAFFTERGVSDFYQIKYNDQRLTADDFNREHERCLNFIKGAVAESSARTKIVLTHHVPTALCTAKEFQDSAINGAFTVELGEYIADSGIDYWIYGHSHRNIDAQIGKTHILSNQLGYVARGEHMTNSFNSGKCIEISQ
ncbi:MAG: metallophosphoesterase [Bacteroidales bacterium]|nr:metallophosphoesterase [Bacteroidales bacterium]